MAYLFFIVLVVCAAAIFAQNRHYHFLERRHDYDASTKLDEDLTKMVKEFEDYKKRVDTLTLKAGFKL